MKYQVLNHQHLFESERYFKQCHASTICFLPNGNLGVAWFAGTKEKATDVAIWFSYQEGIEWSVPRKIADCENIPSWNPVLLTLEKKLFLFYKVGSEIPEWKTMVKISMDNGMTWSEEKELVKGDKGGRGPVKNKCIILKDNSILAPASTEKEEWNCFVDCSKDGGLTWERSQNIPIKRNTLTGTGIIQPTLWQDQSGEVHMFMRSSEGFIYQSTSSDNGKTWSIAEKTSLPNNNCGIDLVRMENGLLILVYNPISGNWAARSPIAFCISKDNGKTWCEPQNLDYVPCTKNIENAEFSYPAIITKGEDVYITYTWKRRTIAFWQIKIWNE